MAIKFYKSHPPYGYLNNFTNARMFVFGHYWDNVEAAFQAQKTYNYDEFYSILNSSTPREARNLGQKVTLRPDWDQIKYFIMKECVLAKFRQNQNLKEKLLSTSNEEIIEDSPIDFYWGCGSDGTGQNNLGKILMEVRDIIKSE